MVASILAKELLQPLLLALALVNAILLEHQLPDAPILLLVRIPALHLLTPQPVPVNPCLLQLVTGLTNGWKKFYFDFHGFPLTAFWMKLDFPKLVTVRVRPRT